MKKIALWGFFLAFMLINSLSSMAQYVISGADVLDGKISNGYYMLLKIDNKHIQKEWKDYLEQFGRVTESSKGNFILTKFRDKNIASAELTIYSKISDFKDFTKVFCVVEESNFDTENENFMNMTSMKNFFEDFYEIAQFNELVRLATLDLEESKLLLKDAETDQKRIEKSLENNLEIQEKLGRSLDQSPAEMVRIIEEKQVILNEQLKNENDEELKKKATAKEKQIVKTQKKQVKNEKKLIKKEEEFDTLKDKLFEAKRQVKFAEELVSEKEKSLKEIIRLNK